MASIAFLMNAIKAEL